MTDTTPNLAWPVIAAAQAQKHVTHNEALHRLDTLVHLAVLDRGLAAPPGAPAINSIGLRRKDSRTAFLSH